ncbi:MAG TPA: cytochrome c-type biogenesis protein CcmH, partial [Candidatus Polarisedimenticolia bacterium]|nr:cytochrome c-type biogenesis protein CcmH [Candidatus Polarisedimenticolia bacterium]
MRTEARGFALITAALAMALAALPPAARAGEPSAARAAGAAAPDAAGREEAALAIEEDLMCHCGCTDLTVRVCNCGVAAGIKDDIRDRLARGQSPAEVEAAYVARFGEQIRSAPTRR